MPMYKQGGKKLHILNELAHEYLNLKEYNANIANKQKGKKIHSSESENNFEI